MTFQENWKNYGTWKWGWYTIVICALRALTIGIVQRLEDLEIRGRVESIQTKALIKLAWILRRVL